MRRKSSVNKPNTLPSPKERSVSLYQRNKGDKAKEIYEFEDFKIVKLVGRGTFGKVYLV